MTWGGVRGDEVGWGGLGGWRLRIGQGRECKAGVLVVYEEERRGGEVEVLVVFGGRWKGLKRKKRKRDERENRGDECDGGWMLEELGLERMDARGHGCWREQLREGIDSREDEY